MTTNTLDKIRNIIKEELPDIDLASLKDQESFMDQDIDSLVRTDIYITLGENFDMELMDVDEEEISSLQKIADYIDGNQGNVTESKSGIDTPNAKVGSPELISAFESLGIKRGDNLLVHSGLLNLGQLSGKSADENLDLIFNSLMEVLGDEGTLVVPSFFYDYGRWEKTFDVNKSESSSRLGAFSSFVTRKDGARRSIHPLTSLAAIGKNASFICDSDCPTSYGVGSPWDKLFELDAKMLFLGVDLSTMTFIHYVEHRFGVPHIYNKFHETPVIKDGKEINKTICSSVRYLDFDITYDKYEYTRIFSEAGIVKVKEIGKSSSYLLGMVDVFNFLVEKLNQDVFFLLKEKPKFRAGEIPMSGQAGEARE